MKKTTICLAALAISASTSSLALIGPNPGAMEEKTYCLGVYSDDEGNMSAGSCDMTRNNEILQSPLGANGCAEGQISQYTTKRDYQESFPIQIHMCMPPNAAQL